MDLDKKTDEISPKAPEVPAQQPHPKRGPWQVCAILGVAIAVVAWVLFFSTPVGAAVAAAVGLVLSALGVKVGRGCQRDLAITAIIATAVLIIVFCIFYWGVPYAIDSL